MSMVINPFNVAALQSFLPGSGLLSGDLFGDSMDISSDTTTLAVVAASRDGAFLNQGSVFVFKNDGGTWSQQAEVFATDPFQDENLGANGAVALSGDGNTLAVGSRTATSSQGCVYVYNRSGSTWSFQAKITSSTAQNSAGFGKSVALSGDGNVLAIGEYKQNAGGTEYGRVHMYTRSAGSWSLDNYFGGPPVTQLRFGSAVSVSSGGAFVAVGAAGEGAVVGGRCYLFEKVSGTWTQRAEHVPSVAGNIVSTALFGDVIKISPDGASIVATAWQGNVKNGGGTSIFGGPGWGRLLAYSAGAFTTTATFVASSPQTTANMGFSLSVDWTNNRVAMGSPAYDGPSRTNSGRVHVFTDSGGTWSETKVLTRAAPQNFDQFGNSVALYGDKVAIGVLQATVNAVSLVGAVDLMSAV